MNNSKSLRYRLLCNFLFVFLNIAVVTHLGMPAAVAQEKPDTVSVTQEQIENYKEVKKAVVEVGEDPDPELVGEASCKSDMCDLT